MVAFGTAGSRKEQATYDNLISRSALVTVMRVPPPNEDDWATANIANAARVPIIQDLANEAWAWTADNEDLGGSEETQNGTADAARHAYVSLLWAREFGGAVSKEIGTAHERTGLNRGAFHSQTVMDMENNAKGITLAGTLPAGASRQEMQKAVIDVLKSGQLTILEDRANPHGSGLLIPSDQ
jgi:hypothetical protein